MSGVAAGQSAMMDLIRAAALLWSLAINDIKFMETIHWTGAYAPGDEVLASYARFVEALPALSPTV